MNSRTNENHWAWRGKDASYRTKHQWLQRHYGKAFVCEIDSTHQATRFHWANISGKYLRKRSDYIQLCPKCHFAYDRRLLHPKGIKHKLAIACKSGHYYTKENTRYRATGYRVCRTCQQEYIKAYGERKKLTWV